MIDLSVILITWRMRDMLDALLATIVRYTEGIEYEIVVVDNNSNDGTIEMLSEKYPQARLIRNSENRGVAAARNQGFAIAKGRYVITLDADMVLKENSLKRLVEFMDATPDAGLCGSQLLWEDGEIQPNARRFPTPLSFIMRRLAFMEWARNTKIIRRHEMREWDHKDTRQVDYLVGACQCIRRKAMDAIGMLDDSIFYGPEDIDYCLRMHLGGWNVYYVHDTAIVHYEQRITKKNLFSRIAFLHLKAIFYLFWKYRGKLTYPRPQPG